jgi:hypothetical protein
VHPTVTEHPEYVAIERERDELSRAELAFRQRAAAERDRRYVAEAEYRRALRAATLSGAEPPDPPPPARPAGDASAFLHRRRELDERERALLAGLGEEVGGDLRRREAELLGAARPLVERLDALAAELRDLTATSRRLATAAGREPGRRWAPLDAAAVATAVRAGRGFLDAEPDPSVSFSPVVQPDDAAAFNGAG